MAGAALTLHRFHSSSCFKFILVVIVVYNFDLTCKFPRASFLEMTSLVLAFLK